MTAKVFFGDFFSLCWFAEECASTGLSQSGRGPLGFEPQLRAESIALHCCPTNFRRIPFPPLFEASIEMLRVSNNDVPSNNKICQLGIKLMSLHDLYFSDQKVVLWQSALRRLNPAGMHTNEG